MCAYLLKKGGQPATPTYMGMRVGRSADPNQKERGHRAGGQPKRTKSGQNHRWFGSARWSCSKGEILRIKRALEQNLRIENLQFFGEIPLNRP